MKEPLSKINILLPVLIFLWIGVWIFQGILPGFSNFSFSFISFTPLDPESSGLQARDERTMSLKSNKSPVLQGGDLTGFTAFTNKINEEIPLAKNEIEDLTRPVVVTVINQVKGEATIPSFKIDPKTLSLSLNPKKTS